MLTPTRPWAAASHRGTGLLLVGLGQGMKVTPTSGSFKAELEEN